MTPVVLVVDDHAPLRILLHDLLVSEGYAVASAVDGANALEVAATLQPDVVLSNLEMPGMDGVALLHALAEQKPAPQVILMSADPAVLAIARRERTAAAFVKPFDIDALLACIAECVHLTPRAA